MSQNISEAIGTTLKGTVVNGLTYLPVWMYRPVTAVLNFVWPGFKRG